ncbi:MAG: permease [Chloroflexota bacterium]|nr:permease [Chloroflexota bacterium]
MAIHKIPNSVYTELAITEGPIPPQAQDWISIFLGILVEATPFLLLGVVVSSLVHVFVSEDTLLRYVPKNPILSLIPALFLGVLMPVCECGNVAVARRFLAKGVPISTCIAFLLAAPILNPVALFATATAFRFQPDMVWLRGGLAFLIAASVGLIVGHFGRGEELLSAAVAADRNHDHSDAHHHHHQHNQGGVGAKLALAADGAGHEFLGMLQVLLIGAGVAAATQVLIPRAAITSLGSGIVFAIIAMMSLAFVLSICSTVDAFFALSYSALFPTPALLAFLVLGPMLGMKSTALMLTAFRPRTVLAIAALTAEMVFVAALLLNLRGVLL